MNPNYNPYKNRKTGVKSSLGKEKVIIIIVVILGLIGYWAYTTILGVESTLEEIQPETRIVEEVATPSETTEPEDTDSDSGSLVKFDLTNYEGTTVDSDLSDEATKELLRETRKDIIKQLEEQGQFNQIEMVNRALDEIETSM